MAHFYDFGVFIGGEGAGLCAACHDDLPDTS